MGDNWDLIVVGAGPAGCSLATRVAEEGHQVLLLEKNISSEIGGDWCVEVEESVFKRVGIDPPQGPELGGEPGSARFFAGDEEAYLDLGPGPCLPVINRPFVQRLIRDALESNVVLKEGCRAVGPLMEDGTVVGVYYEDQEGMRKTVKGRLVADASGMTGTVRGGTPPEWNLSEPVHQADIILARRELRKIDRERAAKQIKPGEMEDKVLIQRVSMFGSYSVESFYLDLEEGTLDILVGIKAGGERPTANDRFKQLEQRYAFIGEKIWGGGGPIPIRKTLDSLVGDGLMILGDSACQVIPAHGSGTASALIAAELASRTANRALAEDRFDRAALWDYCAGFQRERGAILAYYYVMRLASERLTPEQVSKMIEKDIITADVIWHGLVPEPFPIRIGDVVARTLRGISELPLLLRFGTAGLKARKMMAAYHKYPEKYDPSSLWKWSRSLPQLGNLLPDEER